MSNAATGKLFRTPIALRWSDLDALNHVNNARYLTFLEQARIEWFDTVDEPWMTDAFGPVVATATLNFRRPIEYPASIAVELFTEKLGNTSVTIGHRIVADDAPLHCDGHVVAVWSDRRRGKPVPLPAAVRRASELLLQG